MRSGANRLLWWRHMMLLGLTGLLWGNPGFAETEDAALVESLHKRVEARWQALIAHKFEQVYEFNTPEYRQLYSYEFVSNHYAPARWLKAEVLAIELQAPEAAAPEPEPAEKTAEGEKAAEPVVQQQDSAASPDSDSDANNVKAGEQQATVAVRIEYEVSPFPAVMGSGGSGQPLQVDTQITEYWMYTANEWWYVNK